MTEDMHEERLRAVEAFGDAFVSLYSLKIHRVESTYVILLLSVFINHNEVLWAFQQSQCYHNHANLVRCL